MVVNPTLRSWSLILHETPVVSRRQSDDPLMAAHHYTSHRHNFLSFFFFLKHFPSDRSPTEVGSGAAKTHLTVELTVGGNYNTVKLCCGDNVEELLYYSKWAFCWWYSTTVSEFDGTHQKLQNVYVFLSLLQFTLFSTSATQAKNIFWDFFSVLLPSCGRKSIAPAVRTQGVTMQNEKNNNNQLKLYTNTEL